MTNIGSNALQLQAALHLRNEAMNALKASLPQGTGYVVVLHHHGVNTYGSSWDKGRTIELIKTYMQTAASNGSRLSSDPAYSAMVETLKSSAMLALDKALPRVTWGVLVLVPSKGARFIASNMDPMECGRHFIELVKELERDLVHGLTGEKR